MALSFKDVRPLSSAAKVLYENPGVHVRVRRHCLPLQPAGPGALTAVPFAGVGVAAAFRPARWRRPQCAPRTLASHCPHFLTTAARWHAAGRVNFIGHDHIGLTVYDAFKVRPLTVCVFGSWAGTPVHGRPRAEHSLCVACRHRSASMSSRPATEKWAQMLRAVATSSRW